MTEVSGRGPRNRLWEPGRSGNSRGRPTGIKARDLARACTEEAIAALVAALKNPGERVQVAVALLDRSWGKPREQIEQVNVNFDGMGIVAPRLPESIEEWLERRRSELDKLSCCTPLPR